MRRQVCAWAEIESPQARQFRQAATGVITFADWAGRRAKTGVYWCAAGPDTDDSFRVGPVYTTTVVPKDAQCDECGISICELQEMFS
jgi:hypothetical protein